MKAAKANTKYRAKKNMIFNGFIIPKGTIVKSVSYIPSWARQFLGSNEYGSFCYVPIVWKGKTRLVTFKELEEISPKKKKK